MVDVYKKEYAHYEHIKITWYIHFKPIRNPIILNTKIRFFIYNTEQSIKW